MTETKGIEVRKSTTQTEEIVFSANHPTANNLGNVRFSVRLKRVNGELLPYDITVRRDASGVNGTVPPRNLHLTSPQELEDLMSVAAVALNYIEREVNSEPDEE